MAFYNIPFYPVLLQSSFPYNDTFPSSVSSNLPAFQALNLSFIPTPFCNSSPIPPPTLRNLVPIVYQTPSSNGGVYMYGVAMLLMMAFERENNFSKSGKTERFGGGSNYSLKMFFPNERFTTLLCFLCVSSIHSISHTLFWKLSVLFSFRRTRTLRVLYQNSKHPEAGMASRCALILCSLLGYILLFCYSEGQISPLVVVVMSPQDNEMQLTSRNLFCSSLNVMGK